MCGYLMWKLWDGVGVGVGWGGMGMCSGAVRGVMIIVFDVESVGKVATICSKT